MPHRYPGNLPRNVNTDAKYSIRTGADGWEVQLRYRLNRREVYLLSTAGHDELIAMVNAIKEEVNGSAGGPFYINEYFHVLVPTNDGYWYAGTYEQLLEFRLDDQIIGPRAPSELKPGELWLGPHVGIPYVLCAGGGDLKYKTVDGRLERTHTLSDDVGEPLARQLARRLAKVKGDDGGGVYINEAGEFFAPVEQPDGYAYLYLGHLDDDGWFAVPPVPPI